MMRRRMKDERGFIFTMMASMTKLSGEHVEMLPMSPRACSKDDIKRMSEQQELYKGCPIPCFRSVDPERVETCAWSSKF